MLTRPLQVEKIDPRIKRTRQLISDAFYFLIKEKGFQNLSVQDITERAGINRATFYAHFADKYELLDHAISQSFRQEIEKRTLNMCTFSLDNLRNLSSAVCEYLENINGHCASESHFQSLVEAQIRAQIHTLIRHWLDKIPADDRSSQSRDSAAIAATWALYGLASEWSHSKNMPPSEAYAAQILPILAANLGLNIQLA